jgi:hypothetical protein
MIKALLPRRWEVSGDIGFSDPATTGQMMAAIGMVYPFVGKHIYISPDFEQEQMKLSGYAKGHIRLGYYLYLVVSLLLNKYCIAFIKMIFNEFFNDNNNKQEVANDRE